MITETLFLFITVLCFYYFGLVYSKKLNQKAEIIYARGVFAGMLMLALSAVIL
jgi:4-amino-4-deoxy-L-arabinose transferase-like glycosyltransferase